VLAIEVASNAAAELWRRRAAEVSERALGALMLLDVGLLTALLSLTGGPLNPFSSLYLVNIALAAVVLSPRWTWGLAALSAL
jgi:two-component system sensor histidine kinase RegB